MKIKVKQLRIPEEDFLRERPEVLSQWPTGKEVNLEEAIDYHKSLSQGRIFLRVVERLHKEGRTVAFPRGGTPILEDQIKLNRRMIEAGVPLVPITTDSYSRLGQFQRAQQALEDSIRTGEPKLNGYPLVNHGVVNTKKMLEANEAAYDARFNGADNRLLAEIALASGITSVLLDPFLAFGSYNKNATAEECIRNYQYTYRLAGYYTEKGAPITPDLIGWLPNGVFPYTIGLVCQIVATLIAAAQGVKSVTPNVHTHGHILQDIAGIRAVRKLMREYLDRFGHKDFVLPGVFAAPVPIFPCPKSEHTTLAYMVYSAMVGTLGEAEGVVVRTVDEAAGIPTEDAHGITYESTNWIFTVVRQQKFRAENEEINTEEEIIEAEARAILERILELGDSDIAVGFARAVDAGVVDSPMSPNVNSKGAVLGIRDNNGAARYLQFGNLPIPKEIKEFHCLKVAERAKAEGRKMDYRVSIEDFWAFSRGRIIGTSLKPLLEGK